MIKYEVATVLSACCEAFSYRLSIRCFSWLPDRAPSALDNLRQAVGVIAKKPAE